MDSLNQAHRQAARQRFKLSAVALAATLLGFVIATFLAGRQAQQLPAATVRQHRLSEARAQLHKVMLALTDAETGQRGYLLTGNPKYLAPYEMALRRLPGLLASLDEVTRLAPGIKSQIDRLQQHSQLELAELAETIRLDAIGRRADALAMVDSELGQKYMDQLRVEIQLADAELSSEEDSIGGSFVVGVGRTQALASLAGAALVTATVLLTAQFFALYKSQLRAERALRASERKHRTLIEEQSESVVLCDGAGSLRYVNPAYARLAGIDPDHTSSLNLLDSIVRSDHEILCAGLQQALSRQTAVTTRILDIHGMERWIAWRLQAQQKDSSEPLIQAVGRDVTATRQASMALQASEDLLQRTGRIARIGGWKLNLQTNQLTWSEQVRRIHGVPDDYVPTLEAALAFHAEEAREQMRTAIEEACRTGTQWDLELPLTRMSGEQIYVRANGEAERDEHGKVIRLLGTFQDISERKKLELQLAANERFMRAVANHIPARVAYFDRERRFRFINETLLKRLAIPEEEALGQRVESFAKWSHGPEGDEFISAALQGQPQRREYDDPTPEGVRRIEVNLVPHAGVAGEIQGFFSLGIDITHLKRIEAKLRELTDLFDNTTDFIAQADCNGNVHYINKSGRRVAGLTADEPVNGRQFHEFYTTQTCDRFFGEIIPTVNQRGVWIGETQLLGTNGAPIPVNHMVIGHFDAEGRPTRYSSVMRDISAEVAARAELERQTATLNTVIEAIPAMVAVFDRQMRYVLVNRAFERWQGLTREQLLGRTVREMMAPDEYEFNLPYMQRALEGETVSHEKQFPGSAWRHVTITCIPLRFQDGRVGGFFAVAQDITQHREENIRLLLLSERDPLTGLLNRTGLEHHLRTRLDQGDAAAVALLYIDLDHFKPVNDTYGHAVGDRVLQEFASRLQRLVRPTDAVARLGGDEFTIVLSGVRELEDAQRVAEKVVDMAQKPLQLDSQVIRIAASVGAVFDVGGSLDLQRLLERADALAYQAKSAGRGRYVIADPPAQLRSARSA